MNKVLISLFISTAILTSVAFANKTQLSLAQYVALVATNGQIFVKMDQERKLFEKNDRLYTALEDTDYGCSAVIMAKENIKFMNQYPEYKDVPVVKQMYSKYEYLINNIESLYKKENKKCKDYIVQMPTTSLGKTPLVMSESGKEKIYAEFYAKREKIINNAKRASNNIARMKEICPLNKLGTITEMQILNYPSMVNSVDGKKVLEIIKTDRKVLSDLQISLKLNLSDRCPI